MLDGLASPFVSAAKLQTIIQSFAPLKELFNHPHLHEEEKYLWVWLAAQSANGLSFSCSYEQISLALNKPPRLIHRILFRLLITGFLIEDIPIHYGEPTPEMVKKIRTIRFNIPYRAHLVQKDDNALVLPLRRYHPITLNLIKQQEDVNLSQPTSFIKKIYRVIKTLTS